VWSRTYQRLSPHLNASYQWNGSSILAGNPSTGESADFPDLFSYAAGADLAVNHRVTLALDLLGRYYVDAQRLAQETFTARNGVTTFPNIVFNRDSFNALSGSVGGQGERRGSSAAHGQPAVRARRQRRPRPRRAARGD
jgi:hypothetical protein